MTPEGRPDIIVFDSELEQIPNYMWLLLTLGADIFPKSSDVDGAAAKCKEHRMKDRHKKERLLGGACINMIHLVMEHFGR